MFFSEEKNQKTFISPPLPRGEAMARIFAQAQDSKVFWFFSSEKNTFLPLPAPAHPVE
jgi:hypothetical protein